MAEYLSLLIEHDPRDINKIVEVPEYQSQKSSSASGTNVSSQSKEQDLVSLPEAALSRFNLFGLLPKWIYEQLR